MASKEYERLRAALVYAAGDHGKNIASIHATAADQDATAAKLASAREALDAEFKALLDALEGMARATADAMVEETGNAEYADWRQWLTAQADALLRKHGRLA